MKVFRTISEMQNWSHGIRTAHKTLGFVPTMGALHEGHISLINCAREMTDKVVVSIFLNPIQFDNQEDLRTYPISEENDLLLCEAENVDAVFMPTYEKMYPEFYQTNIQVKEITKGLCGASREGHFDGVATVVLKLFNIIQPTHAIFGEKDYQQLVTIRRMVVDLNLPVEIVSRPTVREEDGLALSTRNQRLSKKERQHALALYRSIKAVQATFKNGERNADRLLGAANEILNDEAGIMIDYAEIRDAEFLHPISRVDKDAVYAVAVFVGLVRLIDNCVLKV